MSTGNNTHHCRICGNVNPPDYRHCVKCGKSLLSQAASHSGVKIESPFRLVSIPLAFGIMFMPYIFSWLTLRGGHSSKARIISMSWASFVLFLVIIPKISLDGSLGQGRIADSKNNVSRDITLEMAGVYNHPWDGSVPAVESWLKENLKDPESLHVINWGAVTNGDNDLHTVRCKYRSKNSFGGYVISDRLFVLDRKGNVIHTSAE